MSAKKKDWARVERGLYKRGDVYWIIYTVDGKTVRENTKFTNLELARKALDIKRGEIAQGNYKMKDNSPSLPFDEFADKYLTEAKVEKRGSWERERAALYHLKRFFKDTPVNRIKVTHIKDFKRERMQEIRKSEKNRHLEDREVVYTTVNREISAVQALFNSAVEKELIESNPAHGIKREKEVERQRYLTVDEEQRLLDFCQDGSLKDVFIFAIYTGARRGEIVNLKWEYVQMENGVIVIPASYSKNGETRRLRINDTVRAALKRQSTKAGIVFLNQYGRPWIGSKLSKAFQRVATGVGLEDCRFHDLRHTFASRLAMTGGTLYDIMKMMGHKSFQTTQRYAHLTEDHLNELAKRLDNQGQIHKPPATSQILHKAPNTEEMGHRRNHVNH